MTDNADILREVIERGFGEGDLSVADRFAGATIIEHEYGAPHMNSGPETLKEMIREAPAQMPGLTMTVEDTVVDGDKVWARSVGRSVDTRSGEVL